MNSLILLPASAAQIALGVCALRSFDRVLEWEYRECRAEWARDGKPVGFFWDPPEGTYFGGSYSRLRVALKWVFTRPDWVRAHGKAEQLFRRFKIAVHAFWVLCVVMMVLTSLPAGK